MVFIIFLINALPWLIPLLVGCWGLYVLYVKFDPLSQRNACPANVSHAQLPAQRKPAQQPSTEDVLYFYCSATELGRFIREKRITALELCQKHIDKLLLVNPSINSVGNYRFSQALDEAMVCDDVVNRLTAVFDFLKRKAEQQPPILSSMSTNSLSTTTNPEFLPYTLSTNTQRSAIAYSTTILSPEECPFTLAPYNIDDYPMLTSLSLYTALAPTNLRKEFSLTKPTETISSFLSRVLPPFFGVSCTTKECFALKGMPHTSGLVSRREEVAEYTSPAILNMQRAGFLITGTTNTSELCMWLESTNFVQGITNNPYNLKRTPGGSSGGEGAAVAALASPVGLSSDVGGSTRMPAFFNGTYAHKPTSQYTSCLGQSPSSRGGIPEYFCLVGPITRYPADLWPMLQVLAATQIDVDDAPDQNHVYNANVALLQQQQQQQQQNNNNTNTNPGTLNDVDEKARAEATQQQQQKEEYLYQMLTHNINRNHLGVLNLAPESGRNYHDERQIQLLPRPAMRKADIVALRTEYCTSRDGETLIDLTRQSYHNPHGISAKYDNNQDGNNPHADINHGFCPIEVDGVVMKNLKHFDAKRLKQFSDVDSATHTITASPVLRPKGNIFFKRPTSVGKDLTLLPESTSNTSIFTQHSETTSSTQTSQISTTQLTNATKTTREDNLPPSPQLLALPPQKSASGNGTENSATPAQSTNFSVYSINDSTPNQKQDTTGHDDNTKQQQQQQQSQSQSQQNEQLNEPLSNQLHAQPYQYQTANFLPYPHYSKKYYNYSSLAEHTHGNYPILTSTHPSQVYYRNNAMTTQDVVNSPTTPTHPALEKFRAVHREHIEDASNYIKINELSPFTIDVGQIPVYSLKSFGSCTVPLSRVQPVLQQKQHDAAQHLANVGCQVYEIDLDQIFAYLSYRHLYDQAQQRGTLDKFLASTPHVENTGVELLRPDPHFVANNNNLGGHISASPPSSREATPKHQNNENNNNNNNNALTNHTSSISIKDAQQQDDNNSDNNNNNNNKRIFIDPRVDQRFHVLRQFRFSFEFWSAGMTLTYSAFRELLLQDTTTKTMEEVEMKKQRAAKDKNNSSVDNKKHNGDFTSFEYLTQYTNNHTIPADVVAKLPALHWVVYWVLYVLALVFAAVRHLSIKIFLPLEGIPFFEPLEGNVELARQQALTKSLSAGEAFDQPLDLTSITPISMKDIENPVKYNILQRIFFEIRVASYIIYHIFLSMCCKPLIPVGTPCLACKNLCEDCPGDELCTSCWLSNGNKFNSSDAKLEEENKKKEEKKQQEKEKQKENKYKQSITPKTPNFTKQLIQLQHLEQYEDFLLQKRQKKNGRIALATAASAHETKQNTLHNTFASHFMSNVASPTDGATATATAVAAAATTTNTPTTNPTTLPADAIVDEKPKKQREKPKFYDEFGREIEGDSEFNELFLQSTGSDMYSSYSPVSTTVGTEKVEETSTTGSDITEEEFDGILIAGHRSGHPGESGGEEEEEDDYGDNNGDDGDEEDETTRCAARALVQYKIGNRLVFSHNQLEFGSLQELQYLYKQYTTMKQKYPTCNCTHVLQRARQIKDLNSHHYNITLLSLIRSFMPQTPYTFPALLLALIDRVGDLTPNHTLKTLKKGFDFAEEFNQLLMPSITPNKYQPYGAVLLAPPHPLVAPTHFSPCTKPFNFVYTGIFNQTLTPVTSVPLGLKNNLPTGIQVVGARHCDATTIAIALQLHQQFGGWQPAKRLSSKY